MSGLNLNTGKSLLHNNLHIATIVIESDRDFHFFYLRELFL
jgi:hypothetical protein